MWYALPDLVNYDFSSSKFLIALFTSVVPLSSESKSLTFIEEKLNEEKCSSGRECDRLSSFPSNIGQKISQKKNLFELNDLISHFNLRKWVVGLCLFCIILCGFPSLILASCLLCQVTYQCRRSWQTRCTQGPRRGRDWGLKSPPSPPLAKLVHKVLNSPIPDDETLTKTWHWQNFQCIFWHWRDSNL